MGGLVPSPPPDATSTQRGLVSTGQQSIGGGKAGAGVVLTSTGGHVAIDLATGNNFTHTFTENTTLDAPSNPAGYQTGCIFLKQHASSPKTFAFNSFWKTAGGSGFTISNTNSAEDLLTYIVAPDGSHAILTLAVKGAA